MGRPPDTRLTGIRCPAQDRRQQDPEQKRSTLFDGNGRSAELSGLSVDAQIIESFQIGASLNGHIVDQTANDRN